MAITFWLRNPHLIVPRLRYWLWERQNPDKPWLCPSTVEFCAKSLHSGMKAIEFGSGRSTQWFAGKVGSLISVEHVPEWHAEVSKQLRAKNISTDNYLLIPLDHPESEPERDTYHPTPAYVQVADRLDDQSIDFAVVDGHYRTNCIRHLVPKMAPGGLLLVDDVNIWPSPAALPIPANWPVVDDSTNGIKRCVIWRAP